MSEAVIKVEELGKMYRLSHEQGERYTALRDVLASAFRFGNAKHVPQREEFWALRDVSFQVPRGETVGIVGRNGAGKSTLLKLLSRITAPTRGRIQLRGRVGSLLEVGTGFHPELTGRENIYLNGAVLGMSRADIARKFDEIVAFAEVERFLDTPVKRYSSGMDVRLAFAVAAHLDPDILVVDEVLAVGDLEFQKKCLGRMEQATTVEGRTVLFVSHNLVALRSLCTRAIWLESGQMQLDGRADEVVAKYIARVNRSELSRTWTSDKAPGNDKLRLQRASVSSVSDPSSGQFTVADDLKVEFDYHVAQAGMELHLSVFVWNDQGVPVFNTFPDPGLTPPAKESGVWRSAFVIPGKLLNSACYRVQVYIVANRSQVLSVHDDILNFEVQDQRSPDLGWHGSWEGVVRPILPWVTERVGEADAREPRAQCPE